MSQAITPTVARPVAPAAAAVPAYKSAPSNAGADVTRAFASTLGGTVQGLSTGGPLGAVAGGVSGAVTGLSSDVSVVGNLDAMFAKQLAAQMQMQEFSLRSNTAQANHDAKMAVIRNVKA